MSDPPIETAPDHAALEAAARRSLFWRVCAMPMRLLTTLMFDLKVFGLHNVPSVGGAILVSNHQSYLDPVLLGVRLRRPISYMAKVSLFKNPFFGWLIRSLHAFPVKQGTGDVGAIKQSIREVQSGKLLNIFPEGTRSEDGQIGPILAGVSLVLKRANVPIIPVVIDGAFHAWPPHQKWPRPRRVRMLYGRALDLKGRKAAEVAQMIDQTFRAMLTDLRERASREEAH